MESTLDIGGFVRVAADLLSPGGSCFLVYPEGKRGRLLAAVGAAEALAHAAWAARLFFLPAHIASLFF